MKKRLIAAVCAAILLLSLAACGENGTDGTGTAKANETTSQTEGSSKAEDAFSKAFDADKTYDVDTMAEVEYTINFSKTLDKTALVEQAKQAKAVLDEEELEEYVARMKNVVYQITETTELTDQALKERIEKLSEQYRDTDRITAIIKMKYVCDSAGSSSSGEEKEVEMIEVGGKWYCYMGDGMWSQ